jgi:hypothetical protein
MYIALAPSASLSLSLSAAHIIHYAQAARRHRRRQSRHPHRYTKVNLFLTVRACRRPHVCLRGVGHHFFIMARRETLRIRTTKSRNRHASAWGRNEKISRRIRTAIRINSDRKIRSHKYAYSKQGRVREKWQIFLEILPPVA